MDYAVRQKVMGYFALIIACTYSADAGEIRLKSKGTCHRTIVTLSDLAHVTCDDDDKSKALGAIELFPAPSGTRVVTRHEIATRLTLFSIDLRNFTLTGPQITQVHFEPPKAKPINVTRKQHQAAKQKVTQAIAETLEEKSSEGLFWKVSCELTDEQVLALTRMTETPRVAAPRYPAEQGPQTFLVQDAASPLPEPLRIQTNIEQQHAAYYVVKPVSRGELLKADQVELRPVPERANLDELIFQLDEIVGREATQALRPGRLATKTSFRAPRLVARGEAVDVIAVSSGVRVRTQGRALDDGAYGQLITVELRGKDGKRTKTPARVVGFQRVEIFAGPIQVHHR